MTEKVTEEEIKQIKEHADRLKFSIAEAEKALVARRIAELENQNYILSLFNKYSLKLNVDKIYFDGGIERAEKPADKTDSVKTEDVAAKDTTVTTNVPKRVRKANKDG